MNHLKRAYLSLSRQRKKALLLFGIILTLGSVMTASFGISQSTLLVNQKIRESFVPLLSIEFDSFRHSEEEISVDADEIHPISAKELDTFGELPMVKSFDYSFFMPVENENILPAKGNEIISVMSTRHAPGIEFEEGKRFLVDGRSFTGQDLDEGSNVALVPKALADANDLVVGEQVLFHHLIYGLNTDGENVYVAKTLDIPLTIIGIFDFLEKPYSGYQLESTFITTHKYLLNYQYESRELSDEVMHRDVTTNPEPLYQSLFLFSSADDLELFIGEVGPQLPAYYNFVTTGEAYQRMSAPLAQADQLSKNIFFGSFLVCIILLSLTTFFFLRDRRFELGIYRSLGESKFSIMGVILLEVAMVAFLALSLSIILGFFITTTISETMIQDALVTQEQGLSQGDDPYGDKYRFGQLSETISSEEIHEFYTLRLSTPYILGLYGIGLVTVLLSGILPMIYLFRLSPKKLLM